MAALALALSLLHWWGVERSLDQQMYDMLAALQLQALDPPVRSCSMTELCRGWTLKGVKGRGIGGVGPTLRRCS